MSNVRQQLLILHLALPDLNSKTVAWALYDGSLPPGELQMNAGDQTEPPYESVVAAMQDGWFVIQVSSLPTYFRGTEHENAHLPFEYVLERKVTIS